MANKSVAVLLSSYNGERFLREQIDSVLNQEGVDVTLCVRDDGSSDSTRAILREYADENKIILSEGENLGFALSFRELVRNSPHCDYYAFCDQDDVWLPRKLISAVEVLEREDNSKPLMYFTAVTVVNENLEQIVDKACGYVDENSRNFFASAILNSCANGCTEVFNNATRDAFLRVPAHCMICHDYSILTISSGLGKAIFSHDSQILYRQHSSNTIGYVSGSLKNLMRSLKNFRKRELSRLRFREALTFKYIFYDELSPENRKCIDLITNYKNARRFKRPLKKYIKKTVANRTIRAYVLLLLRLGGL